MRTHISKTVSACFVVLRQIRSICRSLTRPVLQSLVASLVLIRLNYGCSTLARQLNRLQSVMNSASWLVCPARRSEHVSPLLQKLHWLCVPERIDFRLAVLVYRCIDLPQTRNSIMCWVMSNAVKQCHFILYSWCMCCNSLWQTDVCTQMRERASRTGGVCSRGKCPSGALYRGTCPGGCVCLGARGHGSVELSEHLGRPTI